MTILNNRIDSEIIRHTEYNKNMGEIMLTLHFKCDKHGRLIMFKNNNKPVIIKRYSGKMFTKIKNIHFKSRHKYRDYAYDLEELVCLPIPIWVKIEICKYLIKGSTTTRFWISHYEDLLKELKETEERKKDTNEVSDSNEFDKNSDLHGGSGSSGEVDHRAETKSKTKKKGGGVRKSNKKTTFSISEITDSDALALVKVLKRLFKQMTNDAGDQVGGINEMPLINPVKAAREIISRRYDFNRVRKEDLEGNPTRILIAADISGSCTASCGKTVGICRGITIVFPEVTFITHSNGYIYDVIENGKTIELDTDNTDWVQFTKSRRIIGVLLFGDNDGYYLFSKLWQNSDCRVVWLDSYLASYGKVAIGKKVGGYMQDLLITENNVIYIYGVNDHVTASVGLRLALQKWR